MLEQATTTEQGTMTDQGTMTEQSRGTMITEQTDDGIEVWHRRGMMAERRAMAEQVDNGRA